MFFFRKAWVTALPTQETRIFTTEETQLNKGYSAKTCPTKKEDEAYDRIDSKTRE